MWDEGASPATADKTWAQLSLVDVERAKILGYDEYTWNDDGTY